MYNNLYPQQNYYSQQPRNIQYSEPSHSQHHPFQSYQRPNPSLHEFQQQITRQQQQTRQIALRGQSTLPTINNLQISNLLNQNQQIFEDTVRQRQIRSLQKQNQLTQMMEKQTLILQKLLQSNYERYPPPPLKRQAPKYEVNLQSIMLKPLEYYSQQINPVQQQQPQQARFMQQQQQQYQQQQYQQNQPMKPMTRSIEIQTNDELTQYQRLSRMGMANTINSQTQGGQSSWGPNQDGQGEDQDDQQQVKSYKDGKDWNFQINQRGSQNYVPEELLPQRVKSRPLPPGVSKQDNRQRAQHNLKIFKIALSYLLFYWITRIRAIRKKRQAALEEKGKLSVNCMKSFVEYFKETSGKVIFAFTISSANIFITDKKKTSTGEMNKRVLNLKQWVKKLFITLVEQYNASIIDPISIQFLGTIMNEFEYVPQNFLFLFEINRFEYTSYGGLKNTNAERGRMLIITLLFVRVYLYKLLFKPWSDFQDVSKKDSLIQNCSQVGSVMYEITIEYIKSRCFKVGSNQAHLSMDFKNFSRSLGPLVLDTFELPEDPSDLRLLREQEEPLILGMESKEDMKGILEDLVFVHEMESYLEEWAKKIYNLIQTKYEILKDQRKDDYLADKLDFIQVQFKDSPDVMEEYIAQAKRIAAPEAENRQRFHQ